jgi:hypothetical protein
MTSQPAKNKLVFAAEIQGIVKPNKGFILATKSYLESFLPPAHGNLKQAVAPSPLFSIW